MRRCVLALLPWLVACGSSPSHPSPTPTSNPVAASTASAVTISGTIAATNGGQSLPSLTIAVGAQSATTDANGCFAIQLPSPSTSTRLVASGSGIVERSVVVGAASTRSVAIDAIAQDGRFDLAFYREFVRNGYEQPGALQPIRHRIEAPRVYLKTVDEAGAPIDAGTLDTVAASIIDAVSVWTGGRFGVGALERGPDGSRPGWVMIRFPVAITQGQCGRAPVGGEWIELDYHNPQCACDARSRIPPRVVRHEVGHMMGFWHTDSREDLMWGSSSFRWDQCNATAVPREQYHAAIAYSRPVGNTDPDRDPLGVTTLTAARAIP